ncbi:hypothetical protein OBJ94_06805 [Empedobacter falsenii]
MIIVYFTVFRIYKKYYSTNFDRIFAIIVMANIFLINPQVCVYEVLNLDVFGFVSGVTLLLLSGEPSSFLGFGPGLIAEIEVIVK